MRGSLAPLILALAVALALAVVLVFVPPAEAATGKLGLQAAVTKSSLTGQLPPEGSWEGTSALGAMAIFELDLSADVSLGLQPGFTPRDSRQVFKSQGEEIGHVDYLLNYVTVPLVLRVTGNPIGVRGFVTAGLEVSFLLDAEVKVDDVSQDLTDEYQSTTLGALFGAGVMVPLGRQFLTFELRYVQGLNDIVERDNTDEIPGISGPSVKYRGFELMAGYLFPLGRR